MIQSSKYIGQGYVIDYLLQFYLKDKFKSIVSLSSQDNTSKLNFVVENENGAKLGVHVTINTDDSKAAAFIKFVALPFLPCFSKLSSIFNKASLQSILQFS